MAITPHFPQSFPQLPVKKRCCPYLVFGFLATFPQRCVVNVENSESAKCYFLPCFSFIYERVHGKLQFVFFYCFVIYHPNSQNPKKHYNTMVIRLLSFECKINCQKNFSKNYEIIYTIYIHFSAKYSLHLQASA